MLHTKMSVPVNIVADDTRSRVLKLHMLVLVMRARAREHRFLTRLSDVQENSRLDSGK